MTAFIAQCDDYLGERTGKYEWRRIRYTAAGNFMRDNGLDHSHTVFDIGAGMTEFDYCLRTDFDWRGRYIPIDGGIDGTDLNTWMPPRDAEWFVGLEIIEHLHNWQDMIRLIQARATKGIALSTPNPATTDVLGMDATHVTEVWPTQLIDLGFEVRVDSFYGQPDDSLFATWRS